jgi:hypothetical protein
VTGPVVPVTESSVRLIVSVVDDVVEPVSGTDGAVGAEGRVVVVVSVEGSDGVDVLGAFGSDGVEIPVPLVTFVVSVLGSVLPRVDVVSSSTEPDPLPPLLPVPGN